MDDLLQVVYGPASELLDSLNAEDDDGDTDTVELTEIA